MDTAFYNRIKTFAKDVTYKGIYTEEAIVRRELCDEEISIYIRAFRSGVAEALNSLTSD